MIEFFKQPPVIAAIIVVVGAAIIAPLAKKFYFDVQNRLRVEMRAWNFTTSEALKKIVKEQLDAKHDISSPTRMVLNACGYMTVTITNISKKKISGVSVMAPDTSISMILQIDDADEIIEVKKGQLISVGDIQPKHSRPIHIWVFADASDFNFSFLKKRLLRVSADELDTVQLRFPMPRYLWKKYEFRSIWIFLIFVLLLYGALLIFLYIWFHFHP
jgi:hypothetical protein